MTSDPCAGALVPAPGESTSGSEPSEPQTKGTRDDTTLLSDRARNLARGHRTAAAAPASAATTESPEDCAAPALDTVVGRADRPVEPRRAMTNGWADPMLIDGGEP